MKFILLSFGFLLSCASVSKIETLNESVPRPIFRALVQGTVEPLPAKNDYKDRVLTKLTPSFVIHWSEMPTSTLESDLNFLQDRIITSHKSYGTFVKLPIGQKLSRAELQSKDIDLILDVKLETTNDLLSMQIKYLDPVLDFQYGFADFIFKLESEKERSKKNKRLEVFQDKTTLIPLTVSVLEYWSEVQSPKPTEIKAILDSAVRGQISIFSTSPGTTIKLDDKEIGKAPLLDYAILNGKHTLAFSKPGKDPQIRPIIVRAGKKNRIFHEWDDDISQGTIFLTSYPLGLDVIVAGQKKGKTHYAESGVPYGSYPIQFVRSKLNDSFEYANSSIAIRPRTISTLSLPFALEQGVSWEAEDFWTSSGGSPHFSSTFTGTLTFDSSHDLPVGWYGVFSQNMIPDRIVSNVNLGLADELGGRIGFLISEVAGKSTLLLVDKTDFHVISYSGGETEARILASYRWNSEDKEKGRSIVWETDPEKQLLKVYLGSTLVLEKPWDFKSQWQIAILTPHNSFFKGNPLRGIKIHYPDMIKFEEKLKK
ncbi:MAG: PEGA domain-containing protein [Leptospira sp.]|nr:PEGA domain-containing protein [Leptospira sp.]